MAGTGQSTRPTVYPALLYRDARAAVRFLTEALGFTTATLFEGPDGSVVHAELSQGNGLVMLGPAGGEGEFAKLSAGSGPAAVYVVVEDADRHHAHAVAHGAEVVIPLRDQDYGSREYTVRDPEGNLWSFGTYLPDPAARHEGG